MDVIVFLIAATALITVTFLCFCVIKQSHTIEKLSKETQNLTKKVAKLEVGKSLFDEHERNKPIERLVEAAKCSFWDYAFKRYGNDEINVSTVKKVVDSASELYNGYKTFMLDKKEAKQQALWQQEETE